MDKAVAERIVSFDLCTFQPAKYIKSEFQKEQFAVQIRNVFRNGLFGRTVWYAGNREVGRRTILTLQFSLDYAQTYPDEALLIQQIGKALHVTRSFGQDSRWALAGWDCWYVEMRVDGGEDNGRDSELACTQRVHGDALRGSLHDLLAFWR